MVHASLPPYLRQHRLDPPAASTPVFARLPVRCRGSSRGIGYRGGGSPRQPIPSCSRVEWKCDDLNEPSKRAALRLGFRAEGVQQSHFIVKRRNRDTAWFAITSDDWPAVDARLSALRAKYDAVPPTGSDATTAGAGAGVGAGSEADAATDNAATACTAASDRIVARTVPEPAVGVGDAFPAVTVRDGSTKPVALATLLAGRRVVLFAVPGAFTPGCSRTHLPGYVAQAPTLRALGVQDIICISVNDPFVVAAWGEAHKAGGAVRMLADPSSSLPPLLGMAMSAPVFGTPDRLQVRRARNRVCTAVCACALARACGRGCGCGCRCGCVTV